MNQSISIEQLESLMRTATDLQLVDVRSPGEFATGHVPQAVNIPLEQLESRFDDLGPGRIAVLCQSGNRATMACEQLSHRHPEVLVVEGGTNAWIASGHPVVASAANRWSIERQVRLIAGAIVLTASLLAVFVSPGWAFVSAFVGAGLTFAGISNWCGMASLLASMPWNRTDAASAKLQESR